jgi:hypothetical protein
MSAAFVGVISEIDVGNLGKKRARVFCEWVEGQTVDDYCKYLTIVN